MRSFLLAGGLLLAGASMIFAAPVGSLEVRLDPRHTSSHRITDYRLNFFLSLVHLLTVPSIPRLPTTPTLTLYVFLSAVNYKN